MQEEGQQSQMVRLVSSFTIEVASSQARTYCYCTVNLFTLPLQSKGKYSIEEHVWRGNLRPVT